MSQFNTGAQPNPFEENPYRPIGMSYDPILNAPPIGTAQLASLMQRFLGALLDTLLPMLFVLPGYGMFIASMVAAQSQRQQEMDPTVPGLAIGGMGIILLGFIVTLAIQIYLLATRSQTLGKYIMKTQVVDFDTGQPADFVHCGILRILVNSFIASIPCIGFIYFLVDSLYIFREDRRCVHDLIASTTVIDISHR
jgi:uncharacterized RDD family membrane protein YckC